MRYILLMLCLVAGPLAAQTSVGLTGLQAASDAPLEIDADSLAVDNAAGTATFEGNVVVGQGELRMSAGRVEVFYSQAGGIARILATGGVTMVTSAEEVEAREADYRLADDALLLSGDVLLVQGPSALSAQRMRVNLADGSAVLEGRVRTVLQTGDP
ncbi:MAG: LptA/OstA family protein [Shimia sp.]